MRLPSRRTIVAAIGGVLLIVLTGLGAWLWLERAAERAAGDYARAFAEIAPALAPDATAEARAAAVRTLEAVLERHPSGRGAALAAYHLGNLRYARREWALARRAWDRALASGAQGALATQARLGVAYAWEGEGDLARAAAAFQAVLEGLEPRGFGFEEAILGLGRVLEGAGQVEEARRVYRRLLTELPEAPRASEARARLAILGGA